MNLSRSRQIQLFAVLVAVLAVTLWLGNRMAVSTPIAVPVPSGNGSSPGPSAEIQTPARIHLDRLTNTAAEEAGRVNLFQYRAVNRPTDPGRIRPPESTLVTPGGTPPPGGIPPASVNLIPPPPPIALKYQGFAAADTRRPGLTAFLVDEQRRFNAVEGDVIMGRYKVVRVTDTAVEIEDLEFNRRQVLQLAQP